MFPHFTPENTAKSSDALTGRHPLSNPVTIVDSLLGVRRWLDDVPTSDGPIHIASYFRLSEFLSALWGLLFEAAVVRPISLSADQYAVAYMHKAYLVFANACETK